MPLTDTTRVRGLDGKTYSLSSAIVSESDVPGLTKRQRKFIRDTAGLEFITDATFQGIREELVRRFGAVTPMSPR